MEQHKSTLTETAQLVKATVDDYIQPRIEKCDIKVDGGDKSFIYLANKIARENPAANSPDAIEFKIAARKAEAEILEIARADNVEPKKEAVIKNYFTKLVGSFETGSQAVG